MLTIPFLPRPFPLSTHPALRVAQQSTQMEAKCTSKPVSCGVSHVFPVSFQAHLNSVLLFQDVLHYEVTLTDVANTNIVYGQ